MFIYLFFRFMFHPVLLLTDVRSTYSKYLALIAASLAVFTSNLSSYLMYRTSGDVTGWLISSFATLTVLCLIAVMYFPLIHLFEERALPGSRISDMILYSAFALTPLFFTLPLAFISLLLPKGTTLYTLSMIIIVFMIFKNILIGIRENYQLKTTGRALRAFFAPFLLVTALAMLIALLAIIRINYAN